MEKRRIMSLVLASMMTVSGVSSIALADGPKHLGRQNVPKEILEELKTMTEEEREAFKLEQKEERESQREEFLAMKEEKANLKEKIDFERKENPRGPRKHMTKEEKEAFKLMTEEEKEAFKLEQKEEHLINKEDLLAMKEERADLKGKIKAKRDESHIGPRRHMTDEELDAFKSMTEEEKEAFKLEQKEAREENTKGPRK